MNKLFFLIIVFAGIGIPSVFAAQTVNDRIEIDNDDIAAAINAGDLFGYQIEAIGDLDSDGVIDLATIKFSDDSNEANVGSILILFMNGDGSIKNTNEIVMDGTAAGLNGCIANDSTNRDDRSLEQLAFVGDLDGDGEPTIALGANSNDHDTGGGVVVDTGAVYMLELNSDGTVDNCVLITEDSGGFAPADGVYRQDAAANFGWPVIATDLNGDGQNELIVGANSESNLQTDLWVLFLTATGSVSSHPATPVSGLTIGIDSNEFIDDGASISGTKIVVSNQNDGDGGGSVFIVNLSSTGAFVSSTEIAGSSIAGIANNDRFGSGVTPLGDMDNDGINDILVGNELGDDINNNSGEAYILFLNADDALKESQKISNESENTRTGSTPFAASDLFGHGMALWRDAGGSAVIAISATQDDTGAEANSGAIHLFYITRDTTFCQNLTIDELLSSGIYPAENIFDNRDGSLGTIIYGTSGNDLMIASDNGDTLAGSSGDDCIIGGSGNDVLQGNYGNDEIYGNNGNDLIRGHDGDDVLFGGAGDDLLGGSSGSDTLYGGLGNDKLIGGKDNDFLYGNEGDDFLNGRNGMDACDGGSGTNTIIVCEL